MVSNKALTSRLFQYVNMTRRIMESITDKPDDQAEWLNISKLMYHLRQALACSTCGRFVLEIYTPVQEPCHCICSNCREDGSQARQNCTICRLAFQTNGPNGFEINNDLKFTALGFAKSCKLLIDKDIIRKWSDLQVETMNGPVSFGQLVREGYCSERPTDTQNLSDKFRKKVKEKPHHCRCGSGTKKGDSRTSGNLTCLGQRCACYRKSKGCTNCKCIGCKNPNGTSSSDSSQHLAHSLADGSETIQASATTTTIGDQQLLIDGS